MSQIVYVFSVECLGFKRSQSHCRRLYVNHCEIRQVIATYKLNHVHLISHAISKHPHIFTFCSRIVSLVCTDLYSYPQLHCTTPKSVECRANLSKDRIIKQPQPFIKCKSIQI